MTSIMPEDRRVQFCKALFQLLTSVLSKLNRMALRLPVSLSII